MNALISYLVFGLYLLRGGTESESVFIWFSSSIENVAVDTDGSSECVLSWVLSSAVGALRALVLLEDKLSHLNLVFNKSSISTIRFSFFFFKWTFLSKLILEAVIWSWHCWHNNMYQMRDDNIPYLQFWFVEVFFRHYLFTGLDRNIHQENSKWILHISLITKSQRPNSIPDIGQFSRAECQGCAVTKLIGLQINRFS